MTKRLVACLLNISDGRNPEIVNSVAQEAIFRNGPADSSLLSSVLNIFSDRDYNRSVLTIAASIDNIVQSVTQACIEAYKHIDLARHNGGHPRLGSVDLIPIHPLSADVSLLECGAAAKEIASKLADLVPGTSFFLFGGAHDSSVGLVARRKQVRWYAGNQHTDYSSLLPDVGAMPSSRYGMTGVGAIPYVMNCNMTLKTQRLEVGEKIATSIRATSSTGLIGVQAMAFPHENQVEVACNLEGVHAASHEQVKQLSSLSYVYSFEDCYFFTLPAEVERSVRSLAREFDVDVKSYVLRGYTPNRCRTMATHALCEGIGDYWRRQTHVRM